MLSRVLLALLSSGIAGLASPCLFTGTMMAAASTGLDLDGRVAPALLAVPACIVCGAIALAVSRMVLKREWLDCARQMLGPFGVISVIAGAVCLVLVPAFRSERLQPESSPYLATTMYAFVACALSAVGGTVVSALLRWRGQRPVV